MGVREIFEGQASFSQMQFLSGVNRGRDLNYYRKIGLLHGVYEVAFSRFLRMTGLSEPSHLFDSAVNLFLLVCDLSIHPVDGFPCGISSFSRFVFEADPGCRFEYICAAIARDRSSYESCLTKVERDDYFRVSERLMHASNIRHPKEGWDVIQDWSASSPDIRAIMKEKSALNYSSLNMVQRVLLSHFISLTLDRIKHPEFFCWPGYWKTHSEGESWVKELWLKNLSLFSDQENNGGIFIRKFPGIPEENLTKTLDNFFGFNVLFNLVRQWTLEDGPFKFDFAWLSEDHSAIEWQNWAEQLFQEKFGVRISDIGLMK